MGVSRYRNSLGAVNEIANISGLQLTLCIRVVGEIDALGNMDMLTTGVSVKAGI